MTHVGYFKVKHATRLLFYKNSTVTDGTEVDWDDIHKFLHFMDRLEVLVGAFQWWKATWDMSATVALVEQVQLCRETYGTSSFLLYMVFINYCLYTVLHM